MGVMVKKFYTNKFPKNIPDMLAVTLKSDLVKKSGFIIKNSSLATTFSNPLPPPYFPGGGGIINIPGFGILSKRNRAQR